VGYLDERGESTEGNVASMLVFVGENWVEHKFVGLHVLRISEDGFRVFLHRWVNWLNSSGIEMVMAAA
jgi:hypothetical protein